MSIDWSKRTKPLLPVVDVLLKSDEHYVDSLRSPSTSELIRDRGWIEEEEEADYSGIDRSVAPPMISMEVKPGDITLDVERKVVVVEGGGHSIGDIYSYLKESWKPEDGS